MIITIGSNAAAVPRIRMAGYAATKAAVTAFTKCLGLELASHGVRCNIVSPGSTDTPMQRALWPDESAVRDMAGRCDGLVIDLRRWPYQERHAASRHVSDCRAADR